MDESIQNKNLLDPKRVYRQVHHWVEPRVPTAYIKDITIKEIRECLIRPPGFGFDELTINNIQFKLNELDIIAILQDKNDLEEFEIAFFTELFKLIYANCPDTSDTKIDISHQARILCLSHIVFTEEVKNILKRTGFSQKTVSDHVKPYKNYDFAKIIPWKAIGKKSMFDYNQLERLVVEWSVPCLPILRLCTNSAFQRAHDFLVKLYSNLFQCDDQPKELHSIPSKEIKYHIQMRTLQNYAVTQIKSYEVSKKVDTKPDSRAVEPKRRVGVVEFAWTLSPNHSWKGVLSVSRLKIDPNPNLLHLQSLMMKTLINPEVLDPDRFFVTTHWKKEKD